MKTIRPDFYDSFCCIANECKHSCCIGWEIDIDEDTYEYYQSIPGTLGEELQKNTAADPEPHFCLGEGEHCPFLQEDGLCKLIKELGEESLCAICAEHPRFYNEFEEREEMGLGLCCEEAARLLLEGTESLKLLEEGEAAADEGEALRRELFALLQKPEQTLTERFAEAMDFFGRPLPKRDLSDWAGFFLSLERLDESWTEKLQLLQQRGREVDLTEALQHIRYERLCCYLLYRHFLSGEDYGEMLEFCILATGMIAALDALEGYDVEHARLFSSEIEYSDENIPLILAQMR